MNSSTLRALVAGTGLALGVALGFGDARAALVQLDANGAAAGLLGSDNECGGEGGFGNCWAFQTGTQQGQPTNDPLASRAIYKRDSAGANQQPTGREDFGTGVANTYGSKFLITYNSTTKVLGFVYSPQAGDHILHYVVVKQGSHFALFYDANPITSFSVDLDDLGFTNHRGNPNPGWSHLTVFNGGLYPPVVTVAEPASLALLGAGLLGLGLVRRRRRAA